MRESIKIIHQAIENLPAGPVNLGDAGTGPFFGERLFRDQGQPKTWTCPLPLAGDSAAKGVVFSTIEGLISHFELVMTNRGFQTPCEEVYCATEAPERGTGVLHCRRRQPDGLPRPLPPAVVHPFRRLPAPDPRAHLERRGGGAGELEHHRGGVGPVGSTRHDVSKADRNFGLQVDRTRGDRTSADQCAHRRERGGEIKSDIVFQARLRDAAERLQKFCGELGRLIRLLFYGAEDNQSTSKRAPEFTRTRRHGVRLRARCFDPDGT